MRWERAALTLAQNGPHPVTPRLSLGSPHPALRATRTALTRHRNATLARKRARVRNKIVWLPLAHMGIFIRHPLARFCTGRPGGAGEGAGG